MCENVLILGRGIGQVMFQNNALSGLLMLIGIACNSWQLAILAIAGTIVSTLTASLLKYNKRDIRDGLYGFNGTLVGIAIGVFMEINILSILLLIAGSALSTWIAWCFRRQRLLPGFTAPFILVVWFLLIGCHYLYPAVLLHSAVENPEYSADFFSCIQFELGTGDVSRKYLHRMVLSGWNFDNFSSECHLCGDWCSITVVYGFMSICGCHSVECRTSRL